MSWGKCAENDTYQNVMKGVELPVELHKEESFFRKRRTVQIAQNEAFVKSVISFIPTTAWGIPSFGTVSSAKWDGF